MGTASRTLLWSVQQELSHEKHESCGGLKGGDGTMALPGISPVLSAPALLPLSCHHAKLVQKPLWKENKGRSHSLLLSSHLLS